MHQHELDAPVPARPERSAPELAADTPDAAVAVRREGRAVSPQALLRLQRAAGNASVAEALEDPGVHDIVGRGGGQPLDTPVRAAMEDHLGADLSGVRVHTGPTADASAKAVQANAYTVGEDVVFGGGSYAPGTAAGQRMLAHELTHVVQQRSGPVDGTPAAGGIKVSDPSDRFERAAEASADRFVSGGGVQRAGAEQHGARTGTGLQRDAAPEEELQASALQRDEAEESEGEELQASALQRDEAEESEAEELG